jgi:hypothetical protein
VKHYSPGLGKSIEVEVPEAEPISANGKWTRPKVKDSFIGCPTSWMLRILPVIKGSKQLVVGIWLWRRRVICGCNTFSAPNGELKRWGISPGTKRLTLGLLEGAGVITTKTVKGKAPLVTIRPK